MILSSKLNKDPSPFTQHLRSAPSDLPVQPEIKNRTRGDSDHSAPEGYQAKDRKTVLSSNSAPSEGRMKKTYPNLMNDGEYGENMGFWRHGGSPVTMMPWLFKYAKSWSNDLTIWGYPHYRKPPYYQGLCYFFLLYCSAMTRESGFVIYLCSQIHFPWWLVVQSSLKKHIIFLP